MKKLVIIVLFIAVIALSAILGGSLAQTRVPRVAIGNTFNYTYTLDIIQMVPQAVFTIYSKSRMTRLNPWILPK